MQAVASQGHLCWCAYRRQSRLEAFAAADLSVPQAVGVMGFDDLVAGRFSRPPLTTLAPDPAEAGAALVEAVHNHSRKLRQG